VIDASPGTGPTDIHDYVPEDDVSIITNTEELFEEQDESVTIFSPIEKALPYWRHLAPTQAMTQSQSVLNQLWILMTLLIVPMMMKSFCLYFQS
jgi:hypothetical protein